MELSRESVEERTPKHRTGEVTLTVTDAAGDPLTGAAVAVRQVQHKFLFGCTPFMLDRCGDPALEREYRRLYADLFNYATLPFYWGPYEPREGETDRARLEGMANWCRENDIRTKGHPLCWYDSLPEWLREKSDEEVEQLQRSRIAREVADFAGKIDIWDVVNEPVVTPGHTEGANPIASLCERVGRSALVAMNFAAGRKANPRATLILNDFDTTEKYEKVIEQCLCKGVIIDAIGIQSHMHRGYWGPERAWEACERFSRFGLPLHFSELTILSGELKEDDEWHTTRDDWYTTEEGEHRQAAQAREIYSVLFSHQAVEAVTWWNMTDLSAWLGAPAGLIRKDMTPKPVYEVLSELIKDRWWTKELRLTTNEEGRVTFRGFLGRYSAETDGGEGTFELDKSGQLETRVTIGEKRPG